MPRFSVLITDLDNTLYDWVEMWAAAFGTMLRGIVERSGLPQDQLEREIRAIHQKYGTSEYSFVIQEIPSLQQLHPGEDLATAYRDAITAAGEARRQALRLYPDVKETLATLRGMGVLIVGYTESRAFYSKRRVRRLDLDGVLDFLYSPPDHELPDSVTLIRSHENGYYQLQRTVERNLKEGELKPDKNVLLDIIREVGAEPAQCLYVGDSLMKDVAMAQAAGVADVYAEYGAAQEREEYKLLRRVSHWPQNDVVRDQQLHEQRTVVPTYVLRKSFKEILGLGEFSSYAMGGRMSTDKPTAEALALDAWKVTVEVQKHFNDLQLRIRSFAISFVGVVLGAAAVALQQAPESHLSDILAGLGLVGWGAFFVMDGLWYHRFLIAAVNHGKNIEGKLKELTTLDVFGLTTAISAGSPVNVAGGKVRSTGRLGLFYFLGAVIMLVLLGASHFVLRPAGGQTLPEAVRVTVVGDSAMPAPLVALLCPAEARPASDSTENRPARTIAPKR